MVCGPGRDGLVGSFERRLIRCSVVEASLPARVSCMVVETAGLRVGVVDLCVEMVDLCVEMVDVGVEVVDFKMHVWNDVAGRTAVPTLDPRRLQQRRAPPPDTWAWIELTSPASSPVPPITCGRLSSSFDCAFDADSTDPASSSRTTWSARASSPPPLPPPVSVSTDPFPSAPPPPAVKPYSSPR